MTLKIDETDKSLGFTQRDERILVVGSEDSFNQLVETTIHLRGFADKKTYVVAISSPEGFERVFKDGNWSVVLYDFPRTLNSINTSVALSGLDKILAQTKELDTPVLVFEPYITNRSVETMLVGEAIKHGAKDRLARPDISQDLFNNSISTTIRVLLQAERDPLTGLYNRAWFMPKLQLDYSEVERDFNDKENRDKRFSKSSTLAFIDFNDFGKLNSVYTHIGADEALKHVAKGMQDHFRKPDACARFGGDEYALLLSGSLTHSEALELVYKKFEPIVNTKVKNPVGPSYNVGLSIGLATCPDPNKVGSVEEFMIAANQAMYVAKAAKSPDKLLSVAGYIEGSDKPVLYR